MVKLFDSAPPDESQLTAKFGIQPPPMFVRFVQWVYDRCAGEVDAACRLYSSLTRLDSRSSKMLYPGTPMELFAIGGTGGDGSHIGFVVMAPERPENDYPWMHYCPAGHELDFLAPDTPTFLRQILSISLAHKPEHSADAAAVATHLGLPATAPEGERAASYGGPRWWEIGMPKPVYVPPVPEGWHYEPAENEVGVLAPAEAFAPGSSIDVARGGSLDLLFAETERLLCGGFPATALRLLRTPLALWESHGKERHYNLFLEHTKCSYLALGRPMLAKRVNEIE